MDATTLRSDRADAVVALAIHTLLWCLFFTALAIAVPPYDRQFAEWRMKLPALTEVVMDLSRWVTTYWMTIPLVVLPLLAVDGGVFWVLRRGPQTRPLGMAWSLLMTVLPVVALLLSAVSIGLVFVKLVEGIMR